MPEPELEGLTNFLYEMGLLKRYKRTGWLVAGVDNPESIAEHSFRTAIIGYLLALMEGADPATSSPSREHLVLVAASAVRVLEWFAAQMRSAGSGSLYDAVLLVDGPVANRAVLSGLSRWSSGGWVEP